MIAIIFTHASTNLENSFIVVGGLPAPATQLIINYALNTLLGAACNSSAIAFPPFLIYALYKALNLSLNCLSVSKPPGLIV